MDYNYVTDVGVNVCNTEILTSVTKARENFEVKKSVFVTFIMFTKTNMEK